MKNAWIQLRLLIAEKLLSLAITAAPKDTKEREYIAIMVTKYCNQFNNREQKL